MKVGLKANKLSKKNHLRIPIPEANNKTIKHDPIKTLFNIFLSQLRYFYFPWSLSVFYWFAFFLYYFFAHMDFMVVLRHCLEIEVNLQRISKPSCELIWASKGNSFLLNFTSHFYGWKIISTYTFFMCRCCDSDIWLISCRLPFHCWGLGSINIWWRRG